MRTRDEVAATLDGNFKQLMDCLGQLTEEELTAKPIAGTWSVKDVLAHIWSWGDETLATIKAWQKPRPWQQGVEYDDTWNESQVAARQGLPLITVVDGVTGVHRRLIHQLDLADDAHLASVGRAPWGDEMSLIDFIYEMATHYLDHARDLAVYQGHCLDSETENG